MSPSPPPLKRLRVKWGLAAGLFAAGYLWIAPYTTAWWPEGRNGSWLLLSGLGTVYFLIMLWREMGSNRRPGEDALLPDLGWGNVLTISRAFPMALVMGFLFSARPEGIFAWLPGVLYTVASLPDFVDGYLARKTGHVTELGEKLDMNVDSAGVFTATFLAFQYGVVPWWYLPIGLARYLFLLGIFLRERRGLPVYDLPYSHRRRGFAALKMGFMFVMLFPLFGPPGTHLAALAFGLPFAVGFLWDWGLVSGRVRTEMAAKLVPFNRFLLDRLPLLLRILALVLLGPIAVGHLQPGSLFGLGLVEALAALLLFLGIAPRITAIIAVCLIGANQNLAPLTLPLNMLIFVTIGMLFAGSGKLSLWPVEEWLIYNRLGESQHD